jgi:hypothetical protein
MAKGDKNKAEKGGKKKGKEKKDDEEPAPPEQSLGGAPPAGAGGERIGGEDAIRAAAGFNMEFNFGSIFQTGGLEKLIKDIMQEVHSHNTRLNELGTRVMSMPTLKESDDRRDALHEYIDKKIAAKADRTAAVRLTEMLGASDSKIASCKSAIDELRQTIAVNSSTLNSNAAMMEQVKAELEDHRANSVDTAKMDMLEFAQMQSCKEWRATGEAIELLNSKMANLNVDVNSKADAAQMLALAERVGVESHRNRDTAAAMESFAEMAATLEEGVALANEAHEKERLTEFVTASALKRLDELEKRVGDVGKAQKAAAEAAATADKERAEADLARKEADEAKAAMDAEKLEASAAHSCTFATHVRHWM